jgi:mannose-6-phosphate isomerase-like protein (cupin superfamily)
MSGWTKANLATEVDDLAAGAGFGETGEARFAKQRLGLERGGLSYQRLNPGKRQAFGHLHGEQEEVYVVVAGSGRVKLDDDVVELAELDAVRVAAEVKRQFEAGPDGLAFVVFGAPLFEETDAEVLPGWWSD